MCFRRIYSVGGFGHICNFLPPTASPIHKTTKCYLQKGGLWVNPLLFVAFSFPAVSIIFPHCPSLKLSIHHLSILKQDHCSLPKPVPSLMQIYTVWLVISKSMVKWVIHRKSRLYQSTIPSLELRLSFIRIPWYHCFYNFSGYYKSGRLLDSHNTNIIPETTSLGFLAIESLTISMNINYQALQNEQESRVISLVRPAFSVFSGISSLSK